LRPGGSATAQTAGATNARPETLAHATPERAGGAERVMAETPMQPRVAAVSAQAAYWLRTSLKANRREAVVTLDPPDLGRMRISIRQEGRAVTARITVEMPEVEALLREGADAIRKRLNTQGMRLDRLVVETTSQAEAAKPKAAPEQDAHPQNTDDSTGSRDGRYRPSHDSGQPASRDRAPEGAARPGRTIRANARPKEPAPGSVPRRRMGVDVRA
jgi:flagellar hook-length control protein FliK